MIALFPNFSKLSIDDRAEVTRLTAEFEPYSDFNFVSLFCWDTDDTTEVSVLNDNLVVRMADYMTGQVVYSLLGNKRIEETLNQMFELTDRLEFVPEVVIKSIQNRQKYFISEDRDQFDYIYRMRDHVDLQGGHFKVKRNKVNKFTRTYIDQLSLKKIDFNNENDKAEIDEVFKQWTSVRCKENDEVEREEKAIVRLFAVGSSLGLIGVKLYVNKQCAGFSVNEVINDAYAICHFQKSILEFENADVFLSSVVVRDLAHFGCTYINWEQDLGIAGLRNLKQSYNPEFFLKKYTVAKKH